MSIECLEFKSCPSGSLLGFANFWVPKMGLEIYGCGVFQKDGRRWVKLPNREYKDSQTGETKYSSVIWFREKGHSELFGQVALEAIDAWCLANPHGKQDAPPAAEEEELPF